MRRSQLEKDHPTPREQEVQQPRGKNQLNQLKEGGWGLQSEGQSSRWPGGEVGRSQTV